MKADYISGEYHTINPHVTFGYLLDEMFMHLSILTRATIKP